MKFALSAVLALAALVSSTAIDLTKRASPLDVSLTRLSNTKVKAAITNTDTKGYNLLYKGTVLDSAPVQKVDVTSKASSAKFNGLLMRLSTSSLSEDAFVPIAAGETIEVEMDVAEIYDVSTSDKYDVLATGAFDYAEEGSTELTGLALHYTSNRLSMDVDGIEAAKVVKAVAHARKEKRTVLANDCSSSKASALRTAHSNCRRLASTAATAARSGSASKFQEYFKTTSSSARTSVANRMTAVARECSSTTSGATTTYCTDFYGECSGNVLAYTDPSTDEVVYCDLFFDYLPALSSQCHAQDKASTVLHELTHAPGVYSPGTGDYGYGYQAASGLSSQYALANADSYALYANALYAGC